MDVQFKVVNPRDTNAFDGITTMVQVSTPCCNDVIICLGTNMDKLSVADLLKFTYTLQHVCFTTNENGRKTLASTECEKCKKDVVLMHCDVNIIHNAK